MKRRVRRRIFGFQGGELTSGSGMRSRLMFETLMISSSRNSRMSTTAKPSRLSSKALRCMGCFIWGVSPHQRTRSHRTKTPKQNGRLASRSSRPCWCNASYAINPFVRTKHLTIGARSNALSACATGWRSRRPQALLDRPLEPTRLRMPSRADGGDHFKD